MLGGFNMNEYNNPQEYADSMEVTAKKVLKIIGFVILGIAVVLIFSFSVKLLWNWLIPGIFGLRKITYFEGIGLLILAKIFFGGIGGSDSDSKKHKESSPSHEIRGVVSKAIHDEMQQEFKNEYYEKYGDTQDSTTVSEENVEPTIVSNADQEELYDQWWDNEGEKLFESYLTNQTNN